MAGEPTIDEVADALYKLVKDATGLKKYKSMDLVKAAMQLFPGLEKVLAKNAVKLLVDQGRCVYTYFGGSYVELPHQEGAAN